VPVATAAVRRDAEQPEVGYLTLLHFVNDRASLEALLGALSEALRPHGVRTLVGPTHLLPQLGGGALSSHWHLPPPADTPYGPPYAPEHLGALMSPTDALALFQVDTAQELQGGAKVALRGLEPPYLAGDLLPLWQTAFAAPLALPSTAAEARSVLRWLAPRRPFGFSATLPEAPDTPVGFVLLCPEPARPFRKGRDRSGRLWGGVLPGFRRRGVGRALLSVALGAARARGWDTLSVGPVAQGTAAEAFLRACGGVARQHYTLYRTGL